MTHIRIKRLAAVALSLMVAFAFMPVLGQLGDGHAGAVYAAEGDEDIGDYTWHFYQEGPGSAAIVKYKGTDSQVILPVKPEGKSGEYAVSLLQTAFSGNTTIQKIAIPEGIESIYCYGTPEIGVFEGCTSLVELAIQGTGMYLGNNALAGCPSLVTYRIDVTNSTGLEGSGIGQDKDGNIYPGVTVYAKKDSEAWKAIEKINEEHKNDQGWNGNLINLVEDNDPYAHNTVVPTDGGKNDDGNNGDGNKDNDDNNKGDGNKDNGGKDNSNKDNGDGNKDNGNKDNSNKDNGGKNGGADKNNGKDSKAEYKKGNDGTPIGKGASVKTAEKAITAYSSEKDMKGSVYGLLQAKAVKATKKNIKLSWKKAGAKKFIVYGTKCGKKNKPAKIMETKKSSVMIKKVDKKKLKKGTYYKFIIVAANAKNEVVSTSKMIHEATAGGKVGNDKKVKTNAKKNKVVIKAKKKFKLKAKEVPASKKLKVKRHRKVAYESSNTKIVTVSGKGVIKGLKKGKCKVYAYAQNGVCQVIKVMVK